MTTNNNDFFLDIENLGETPETPASNDALGIQDLVIAAKPIVEAKPKPVNASQNLQDIYDRMMKLLFLFDTSGSMADTIVDDSDFDQWIWDMKEIRAKLADCHAAVERARNSQEFAALKASEGFVVGDDEAELLSDPSMGLDDMTIRAASFLNSTDDDIKAFILREDLTGYFNVLPIGRPKTRSKMAVVKDLATGEIRKRIQKYNEADIRVLTFDQAPHTSGARTEKELVTSISSMSPAGGTDIFRAVESALSLCKKSPSPVNLHHLVLISDGQDYGAVQVEGLLPRMKDLGVVFDFIFIEGGHGSGIPEVAKSLERVCKATGGEYVVVKRVKDLTTKFIAAAERKCLPAPK